MFQELKIFLDPIMTTLESRKSILEEPHIVLPEKLAKRDKRYIFDENNIDIKVF